MISSDSINSIKSGLLRSFPARVVEELLEAYGAAKRSYYLGGLRLAEVEGGRFCEAAFRMLEHKTTGKHTPLGKQLKTDKLIPQLAQMPGSLNTESIRLHIPRALRVIYDIRNKRDAAHLADGIDPNLQDAILVTSILDWILAEFVRLEHNVSAETAQQIIEKLVTRKAPAIEDFSGFLKVLNPNLSAGDYILLLLYQRGKEGASYKELSAWIRPKMRPNLQRTLGRLNDNYAHIHFDGSRYLLSATGIQEVERKKLYEVR